MGSPSKYQSRFSSFSLLNKQRSCFEQKFNRSTTVLATMNDHSNDDERFLLSSLLLVITLITDDVVLLLLKNEILLVITFYAW
mmetsp:Transcript_2828/g.5294  ORF Transcript_2828/g.5294 Transcript_2828/m.5294 type:complete len:83 (-) Transcript_2828:1217-1465(-)